ncbi:MULTISPECIES: LysR substrate-binding domain-containing protein [Kribbella]|uniref:LysR family transcriptional regulator n=1 Tax=Kribbella karoonensis TaxID=324851 RepID=A0ABP4Q797_9ACTN
MELRHLRYFATVAETCHFGQAAERLHMAQPALSQSIRQLEAELGAVLLTRTTRQVRLTPAGEFFYDEARRILHQLDGAISGVRRVADGHRGLVRIGFTGTAAFTQLPRFARILQSRLPDVALEVHADMLTPAQTEGLLDGSLDLGVLRPPASGDLEVRTIESEPLVLAISADHRLADGPEIALTDLATEAFVLYSRNSAVNDAVQRVCQEAGFTPRREHEAPGTAVLLPLVAAGLGVALVPGSVRAVPLDGVVFREVRDAGSIDLALAWRRDESSPLVGSVLAELDAAGIFRPAHPTAEEPTR